MGLFEGRTRVKRATTAPHGNLSIDVFIANNKLGKRVSKSIMEPPDPDTEPPDRRLRLPGYPQQVRALRQRPPPAADEPPPPPSPLTNGCNGHSEPARRRLTEAQKLLLNSECHKTEIFATKLRHIPGRPAGAPPPPHQNGERPRRRRRSDEETAAPARKRVSLDSLLLRDNHEYYKVEILSGKLRSSRRLSGDSDGAQPALELDQPEDAAPEDSCDSFRVVRRGFGRRLRGRGHCGTPHGCRPPPGQRPAAPAAAEADTSDSEESGGEAAAAMEPAAAPQLGFSFEAAPEAEQWYQTYARETNGRNVVGDVAGAATGVGPRLPYQMADEELFPAAPTPPPPPGGSRAAGAARAKHRRLLQVAADSARKSPRCHASTRAARCSVDAAEGVALWDSSLEQVQLVAASISSLLTAAEEQHEPLQQAGMPAPAAGRRRRRRTASLSEPEQAPPDHLSGLSLAAAPLDLTDLLRAEPVCPRQPEELLSARPPPPQRREDEDSESVSTESTASSVLGRRRRGGRRRSNRTGWPRSRARRPGLLQKAVSRAAATVRASASRRRTR